MIATLHACGLIQYGLFTCWKFGFAFDHWVRDLLLQVLGLFQSIGLTSSLRRINTIFWTLTFVDELVFQWIAAVMMSFASR